MLPVVSSFSAPVPYISTVTPFVKRRFCQVVFQHSQDASRPKAQPESNLSTWSIDFPDLPSMTAHPGARPVAGRAFCRETLPILSHHVYKPSNGVCLVQLLRIEVFPDRIGEMRGWLPLTEVRR
jgi:hypothetical protein